MPTGDEHPELAFGLLGPLTVAVGGVPIVLGAPKTRILLACLLLRRGTVVATDLLVDRLWDDEPPPGARNAVHTYIRRLRTALGPAGRQIRTGPSGYLIEVPADAVDLDRFRGHLARARSAGVDPVAEFRELRAGLALWRGTPLSDVHSDSLHRHEVPRLVEEWLQAVERRIDLDLAAGRGAELIAEMRALTTDHPLREGLWHRLMLALHRVGRQAEALATFLEVSAVLRDELGVDPGKELTDLHQQIIGGPPASAEPASAGSGWAPAFQLPAEVVDFVGRADLVERIQTLIGLPDQARRGVPVVILSGPPGVGKTELAINVAHRLRGRFPDGQLFVNLSGYSPNPPVRPVEALPRFLRALGVAPDRIPLELDEQSALLRTMLSDRRVLLVLDNAVGPDQVRPLLPGNATCAVIVTSRDSLHGLSAMNGAHRVPVDLVTRAEAEALLSAIIGPERAATEPEALGDLAVAAGLLPLALRIAASHLATTPGKPIATYLSELRGGDRISALAIEGDHQAAVRSAFDLSYEALKPEPARLFGLLGLVPGADFDRHAAANLAGISSAESQPILGALTAANLIQQHRPGRFHFHDLVREYARGKARSREGADGCAAAGRRLFDFYLYAADAAGRLLYPDQPRLAKPDPGVDLRLPRWDGPLDALAWLDAEAPNLVAAAGEESAEVSGAPVWLLADALLGFVVRQRHDAMWLGMFATAVAAAERAGDLPAVAALRRSLGRLHFQRGQYPQARDCYLSAADLFQQLADRGGEGRVLLGLGTIAFETQEYTDSVRHFTGALELLREHGDRAGEATTLTNLGSTLIIAGAIDEGVRRTIEAGTIAAELGLRHLHLRTIVNVALAHTWRGRLELAVEQLDSVLASLVELGYVEGQSEALRILAEVHLEAGRTSEAITAAGQALDLATEIGAQWTATGARVLLGGAYLRADEVEAAWNQLTLARDLLGPSGGYWFSHVQLGLAASHRGRGEPAIAADLVGPLTTSPQPRVRCRAHAELALVALGQGDHEAAIALAEQARDIAARYGYRLDEQRADAFLRLLRN